MVDTVITNPGDTEVNPTIDLANDPEAAAAIKAAQDGGVVVNGETLSPPAEAPAAHPRPDNVPEKFWDATEGKVNVDALLKSQHELEAKFTQNQQGKAPAEGAENNTETPADQSLAQTNQSFVEAAMEEYDSNSELSPETYIKLEKAGYSPEIVNAYIDGHVARQELENQKAYSAAGGTQETFNAMVDWAKETLNPQEIAAFNTQVTNPETSEYAVQQLYARYASEADIEPSLLTGDTPGSSGGFFKSSREMTEAMASKKYQTDPAFRKEVEQKIAASEKQGVRLFG